MKYKLINPINPKYNTTTQILVNRGIHYNDISHYMNTTDNDISPPEAFGAERMKTAVKLLINTIQTNRSAIVIVDCDADGYTSAALLINYLYSLFPQWVSHKLSWILHTGKQHGLSDCISKLVLLKPALVILPDAGTNDVEECKVLRKNCANIIILDHHDKEINNDYANVIINNQISDYPNKELSGVGVTWQFCRFIDKLLNINYANYYLDLVALGLIADMMSLKSIETKHLIQKGINSLHNPFIVYLADKNSYSLKDKITPIGAAFYLAPFINAIVRSGTQEEKEVVFKSMLSFTAFQIVPSTKRGRKDSDTEKLVEQAMRIVTNVKARQTKAQNDGMTLLEQKIKQDDMLNQHHILLFLLNKDEIEENIAGLVANKIMSKYQCPVCILIKHIEKNPSKDSKYGSVENEYICTYRGSARGCDKVDITNFKSLCASTKLIEYAIGHPSAFGLSIKQENITAFLQTIDHILAVADISKEPIYYVDYIDTVNTLDPQRILDMASMENYWGKDISEALIAIKDLQITVDMVTIYDKRSTTIKIQLPNQIDLMLFNATEKDCEVLQLNNTGSVTIDVVGTCQRNEWMGNITPQIFITEYEVKDSKKYIF